MTVKHERSSPDAEQIVLYAKTSSTSELAYPVLATSSGCLLVSEGLDIPAFDSIVLSYSGSNVTQAQYYIGGTGGTLVATISLAYSGSNITSVVRT